MIIREFRPTDSVPRLTELLHAAYKRLLDLGMKYVATVQEEAVTLDRLQKGQGFVAEDGGLLIGTIVVEDQKKTRGCGWYNRPDVASFHQFAVDPARQGEGIGMALVKRAEAAATAAGASELALDTSEWAYHLIDWYGSIGFRIVDETQWKGVNYRSVIMSKTLGEPARDFSRAPLGRQPEFLRGEPTAEHREEAKELERKIGRGGLVSRRHEVFGRLGELYRILREAPKALRLLEMASVAAVARGDYKALLTQRLRTGIAYQYAGKHATANHIFARLVSAFEGNSERLGFVHQHYGKCLAEQDRLEEALVHFRRAETLRSEEGVADSLRASTAEALAELANLMNRTAYERMASVYAGDQADEDDPVSRKACREAFQSRLKGKKVLEVGCGPGTDSKLLAEQGLDVTATDFSEPFLQIVRQRYPKMKTAWLDVTRAFDLGKFDGVYGHSCFLHIPRELAEAAVTHMRDALAPGGVLFLALVKSSKVRHYTHPNWGGLDGNTAEFYCYAPEEMTTLFAAAGLVDVQVLGIDWSADSAYRKGAIKDRMLEKGLSPYQIIGQLPGGS